MEEKHHHLTGLVCAWPASHRKRESGDTSIPPW